jgi:hypothetical protein
MTARKAKAKATAKAKEEADPCGMTVRTAKSKYRGLSTAHDEKPSCFGRDDELLC